LYDWNLKLQLSGQHMEAVQAILGGEDVLEVVIRPWVFMKLIFPQV